MSKFTIGTVAAGAALASVAALVVFTAVGNDNENTNGKTASDVALQAEATIAVSDPAVADNPGSESAVQPGQAATQPKAATTKTVPAVKPVRSVKLTFPTDASKVGANVTGSIRVVDTAGKVVTPAEGAAVALQQLRGKVYVTIADGVTTDAGDFPVSFTSKVNATWRAELTPTSGKKLYSASVSTKASASATWAARPDMDVTHGVAMSYAFRVNSETATTGHLEIANSKTPTKWIPLKAVAVPATEVVTQLQKFPSAGTWLLRGASASTATNAPGYTTTLTVTVR